MKVFDFTYVFIIISSVWAVNLYGQNLVPNSSFEDYNTCPEYFAEDAYQSYVKVWDSPNKGTPDYFNACSQNAGVPRNWVGYAETFDGSAYMGLIACMEQLDNRQIAYREYIRVQLMETLEPGKKYYASMQVQLGLSSIAASNGLGMFFTDNSMQTYESMNYPVAPQVSSVQVQQSKENWTQVCGTFEAQGGEYFLLIGNFLSNQDMKYKKFDENLIPTRHISPMAYYYIDAVEVHPYVDSLHQNCETKEEEPAIVYDGTLDTQKKMVLDNLYFETNKAVILPESYRELDQLAYELRKNQRLKLSIFGHTDDIGTDEYNQKLSEDRAIAVRNYLLKRGVSKFRMNANGFGSSQPIGSNETDKGRQQNRRVEIKVEK